MEVELWGRVQYQRVGRFLTLRDQYGMTQVVAPDDVSSLLSRGTFITSNYFEIVPVSCYFHNLEHALP
jgi:hypothetical protein